jgi:hypothetical protein
MVRPEEWRSSRGRRRSPRPESVVVGSGHRSACLFAVGLSLVSAAVAGWWLIGDLSERGRPRADLDFSWRAPNVPHWVVAMLGPIALVALVGTFVAIFFGVVRQTIDRRWCRVVFLCAVAGWMIAGIARVNTAGVIGANIGGGLALLFGGPIVLALLGWVALDAGMIFRSGAESRSPSTR